MRPKLTFSHLLLFALMTGMILVGCKDDDPAPDDPFARLWSELEGEYRGECLYTISSGGGSTSSSYLDTVNLSIPDNLENILEVNDSQGDFMGYRVVHESGENMDEELRFTMQEEEDDLNVTLVFSNNWDSLRATKSSNPFSGGFVSHNCYCAKVQ